MKTKEERRKKMTDGGLLTSCLSEAMGDWINTFSDKEIHAMHNAMKIYSTQQLQSERDKVKKLREALGGSVSLIRGTFPMVNSLSLLNKIEQTLKETEGPE